MSKPYFEAHASVVLALADLDGLSQVAILRDVLATVRKRLSETNPELSSLESARKAKDRDRKRLESERKRLEKARKVSGNGPEMAQGPVTPSLSLSLSLLDQGLSLVSPLPLSEADPRGNGTSTARATPAPVVVHGALPASASYMVGVYESAVACALGVTRWSMGLRASDNAHAVAKVLDEWAVDDDGTPLVAANTRDRQAWLELNASAFVAQDVKPHANGPEAKFNPPSLNCFVRWLTKTAPKLAEERPSGVRRALDAPTSAGALLSVPKAGGAP